LPKPSGSYSQLPSSLLIENASTWFFGTQGRSFVRRGIPDQANDYTAN
jgi:hypothetical protein